MSIGPYQSTRLNRYDASAEFRGGNEAADFSRCFGWRGSIAAGGAGAAACDASHRIPEQRLTRIL